MLYAKFQKSWTDALAEHRFKNLIIGGLLVALVGATYGALMSEKTTVIVPANLTEEVSVAVNKASEGYKKAYAINIATLLGNITPGNADFVMEAIGAFFDPKAYRLLANTLTDQVEAIREDSITVQFEPQKTMYEPETDKVFVYGAFSSTGVTGTPKRFMRTYEMTFDVRAGRLWATSFTPYVGAPRTVEFLQSQPDAETVAQAKQ